MKNADKLKTVYMVVAQDDIAQIPECDSNEEIALIDRIAGQYTFGTHLDNFIAVFPQVIVKDFQTGEAIMRKLNYTTVHEIIHNLLDGVELNYEEYAHALAMLLLQDSDSNCTGFGFTTLQQLIHEYGIEREIEGEEAESEAELTNEARESSRKQLAGKHILTGL